MRPLRLVQAVLALVLAVPAVPADAAAGELVVYADGPGWVTVNLPRPLDSDWSRHVTVETSSRYAVLLALADTDVAFVAAKIPGFQELFPYDTFYESLPRGPVTFRVTTRGKTTFRIPVKGTGRTRVWATRRLQGGVVHLATVQPVLPNVAHHEMPVDIPASSLVIHGYDTTLGGGETRWLCLQAQAGTCPVGDAQRGGSIFRFHLYHPDTAPDGALHATMTVAEDGLLSSLLHYVITVPAW